MKKHLTRKAMSLCLALIMALALVACGNNSVNNNGSTNQNNGNTSDGGEIAYKDRVVIANSATLLKLDPQSNNTGVNGQIYEMTHNTLVTADYSTNELQGELAYEWEQPDDVTYIFHLEEGVTFQNGEPFTAADVIYTFERAAGTSYQFSKVQDIASMEAEDDYTLKITLSKPNAEFLDNLTSPNMSILCEAAIEEDGDDWGAAVGTGAYTLTEWVPDDYTLLTRNDNYWGDLPPTKEIMYRKMSEASARVIALQTGEVDVCLDVPAVEASHVADDANCRLIQMPSTKLVYIALNTSGFNDALTDKNVRLALNYATNVDDIIIGTKEGFAEYANGVIPQGVWGYSDSVSAYSYDLEKAKELLAEAGYADGLDISFSYEEAIYPGLYEMLQAQWALAGVNLILNTNDSATVEEQLVDGSYDITVAQWSFSGIDYSLRSLWYSNSGSNRTLTADSTLDAMLDAAVGEMDRTKREAAYAEISQYMTDTAAMIPMYVDTLLYGEGAGVSGVVYNGNARHIFTYITAEQ